MSHFYKISKDGSATLLKTIDTVAKARKSKGAVASVTTCLSLAPNPFMSQWREKRLVELARSNPEADYEQLSELAWGVRTCPETGDDISSSEFGTRLHKAIEDSNLEVITGHDFVVNKSVYDPWVHLWSQWCYDNDVERLKAELCIGCNERKVAGTIDFIGKMDGKVFLADYKTRPFKDKASMPVYPKDVQQLALEAQMIKELWNLDYLPETYTVLLDPDEPLMHVKKHTAAAQAKAYDKAMSCVQFYNKYNDL